MSSRSTNDEAEAMDPVESGARESRLWRVGAMLALAIGLTVTGTARGEAVSGGGGAVADSAIVARWRGGELTWRDLRERHDLDSTRTVDRSVLEAHLVKAVYLEIYLARARALGLEESPAFEEAMETWRRRELARLFRERRAPGWEMAEEEARRYYEAQREDFRVPGTADFDLLFVRCALEETACLDRLREVQAELAAGGDLVALAHREAELSGGANGAFEAVDLGSLSPALRWAAGEAAEDEIHGPVVTSLGAFWLRVRARRMPEVPSYEAVRGSVHRALGAKKYREWVESLRTSLDLEDPAVDEITVLAAAARREGMHREEAFLESEAAARPWQLADLGFLSHTEILPGDEAAQAWVAERVAELRRYRLTIGWVEGHDLAALERGLELARAMRDSPAAVGAPHLEVLEEISGADLARYDRRLPEILASVAEGSVVGPVVLRRDAGGPGDVAIVAVDRAELPALEEVRPVILRNHRARIGSGVAAFMRWVGGYWDVEILLDEALSEAD